MGNFRHFIIFPLALLSIYLISCTSAETVDTPANIDPLSESKTKTAAVSGDNSGVRAPRHIPRGYCGRKGAYCYRTKNCCAGQCHGGICVAVDGDDPNYPKPTEKPAVGADAAAAAPARRR